MISNKKIALLFSLSLVCFLAFAQAPKVNTSSDIHGQIQKLNVLGSVLYVAAHPDDENTRLISYFANAKNLETTYLSLTRGDGGQNLIGPEIRELLGVIRTQELLAARRIDGGKQLFSRANDFGFSKSPIETMEIWNKDEVLSDIVYTIRKVQPDIIINRFSNDLESTTHGHHTASAVLSTEAFDLANDPTKYASQLKYVSVWQPKRLFFNTSWWFYGSQEAFEKADKSNMIGIDAGVFFPMKGKSNGEIAAESRSMHKCQGMGSTGSRGESIEYVELLKGQKLMANDDPFSGIDLTWGRLKNASHITEMVRQIEQDFDYAQPAKSITGLLKVRAEILKLEASKWKSIKLEEINNIITNCAGFFAEAIASEAEASPEQELDVRFEFTNRLATDMAITSIHLLPAGSQMDSVIALPTNVSVRHTLKIEIPKDAKYSNAYWLEEPAELGMYNVSDQTLRGLPERETSTKAIVGINIQGVDISMELPVMYKKTDPVKAEVYRPFEIIPAAVLNPTEQVYVFAEDLPKVVKVLVKAGIENMSGQVTLTTPTGNWKVEPKFIDISTTLKGEEKIVSFNVTAPKNQEETNISASIKVNDVVYNQKKISIEYDHIPAQMVLSPAEAKIVKIDLKRTGQFIGYVMGAGDEIPASLEQIGYNVELIDPDDISYENLKRFDAVILGVRAFNTVDRLKFKMDALFKYVEMGGNMVVQYNTSRGLVTDDIAPYALTLGRDRVTMEEAPVRMLAPDHKVLNEPNKITQADFDGWVQERGLYFASEWAPEFVPILSSNDPGDEPMDGGLLIAPYGEGYYVFTGYSWFRELPAGVPGAYRIFTNLISLGNLNRS